MFVSAHLSDSFSPFSPNLLYPASLIPFLSLVFQALSHGWAFAHVVPPPHPTTLTYHLDLSLKYHFFKEALPQGQVPQLYAH